MAGGRTLRELVALGRDTRVHNILCSSSSLSTSEGKRERRLYDGKGPVNSQEETTLFVEHQEVTWVVDDLVHHDHPRVVGVKVAWDRGDGMGVEGV